MKSLASLVLAAALLVPAVLFADEDAGDNNLSLTWYPIQAFVGLYSMEGELALTDHLSLALEGKYLHWDLSHDWLGGDWELSILSIGPGLRYYASRSLHGFFIGPYVSYVSSSFTYTDSGTGNQGKASLKGYNAALWTGYKLVIRSVFLELSTGISYLSVKPEVTYIDSSGFSATKTFDVGMGGVYWPGIGFGIGFLF